MQTTKIDYLTHTWNPITGCLHTLKECPVVTNCWARQEAARFPEHYGAGFRAKIHWERLGEPLRRVKHARIGVGFMGDMFGDFQNPLWQRDVLRMVRLAPQHTFLFLTKAGHNLPRENPWPDNAWVGVSVTGALPDVDRRNLKALAQVQAPVRWVSYEPVLGPFHGTPAEYSLIDIDWLVIGVETGHGQAPRLPPETVGWVAEVEARADALGIPVYRKGNLVKALGLPPRQELPREGGNSREQCGSGPRQARSPRPIIWARRAGCRRSS